MDAEPDKVVDKGHISFFLLPRKLRRMIYKCLLSAEGAVVNQRSEDLFIRPTPIYPNILSTCKDIYHEAIAVLYGENVFRYRFQNSEIWRRPNDRVETQLSIIFPDIHVACLLNSVQLMIGMKTLDKEEQLVASFIECLTGTMPRRRTFEIAFILDNETRPLRCSLCGPFIQSITRLIGFCQVSIRLPSSRSEELRDTKWPKTFTLELEDYLGPNRSRFKDTLEFQPNNKPSGWDTLHISPLMILPTNVRIRIYLYVIGVKQRIDYPPDKRDPSTLSSHSEHRHLQTYNPDIDLALLQTCRKIREEALEVLYGDNEISFQFDFSDREHLPPSRVPKEITDILTDVIVYVKNNECYTSLDPNLLLDRFLRKLSRPTEITKCGFTLRRNHLSILVSLTGFAVREASYIPDDFTSLNPDESFSESVSDSIAMQLACLLGRKGDMRSWRTLTIEFEDDMNFDLWDPKITRYLERRLGPNLWREAYKTDLLFHPAEYNRLISVSYTEAKAAMIMLTRAALPIPEYIANMRNHPPWQHWDPSTGEQDPSAHDWNDTSDYNTRSEDYSDDGCSDHEFEGVSTVTEDAIDPIPSASLAEHEHSDTLSEGAIEAVDAIEASEFAETYKTQAYISSEDGDV